jgi:hypothetical protein
MGYHRAGFEVVGVDHKQYKRDRRYPRVRRDELLDGHELVNDNLRTRIEAQRAEIAALTFEVKRLTELAEVRAGEIADLQARLLAVAEL